jgi:hypothetical protein
MLRLGYLLPLEPNWGACESGRNLLGPQALKLPVARSSSQYRKKEASTVKAANKQTKNPSTRDCI